MSQPHSEIGLESLTLLFSSLPPPLPIPSTNKQVVEEEDVGMEPEQKTGAVEEEGGVPDEMDNVNLEFPATPEPEQKMSAVEEKEARVPRSEGDNGIEPLRVPRRSRGGVPLVRTPVNGCNLETVETMVACLENWRYNPLVGEASNVLFEQVRRPYKIGSPSDEIVTKYRGESEGNLPIGPLCMSVHEYYDMMDDNVLFGDKPGLPKFANLRAWRLKIFEWAVQLKILDMKTFYFVWRAYFYQLNDIYQPFHPSLLFAIVGSCFFFWWHCLICGGFDFFSAMDVFGPDPYNKELTDEEINTVLQLKEWKPTAIQCQLRPHDAKPYGSGITSQMFLSNEEDISAQRQAPVNKAVEKVRKFQAQLKKWERKLNESEMTDMCQDLSDFKDVLGELNLTIDQGVWGGGIARSRDLFLFLIRFEQQSVPK